MKAGSINSTLGMMLSSPFSPLLQRSSKGVTAFGHHRRARLAAPIIRGPPHSGGSLPQRRGRHPRHFPPTPSAPAPAPISGTVARWLHHPSDAVDGSDATGDGPTRDSAVVSVTGDAKNATTNDEAVEGDETWKNPRSRWARRKHRKKIEKLQQQGQENDADQGMLDWESFEFGTSPKMDKRFKEKAGATSPSNQTGIPDHILNTISSDSITYQTYLEMEANLDESASDHSLKAQSALLSLPPDLVERSIDILSPYVQPRRLERIEKVLSQRTRHTRFLFENPSNPSNVWACLRTLDSFGIQYVDIIIKSESYRGKAAVNQKRGMRTAMGSAMWMTIRQFRSVDDAVTSLREEEGCLIFASDLNSAARDVRDVTWDVNFGCRGTKGDVDARGDHRPICIVMGNEERGISDEMRGLADETFYLPMSGFAESFNLSVATAITLAYMCAASGRGASTDEGGGGRPNVLGPGNSLGTGPLRPGDLDPHELQCLKLRGVLNSLAQKRMGKALLKKEGIELPESLYF